MYLTLIADGNAGHERDDAASDGDDAGADGHERGRAVQVDPMTPVLKPPGTNRLKLQYDILLSTSAFKFNLRRYCGVGGVMDPMAAMQHMQHLVGRCGFTLSWTRVDPVLTPRLASLTS